MKTMKLPKALKKYGCAALPDKNWYLWQSTPKTYQTLNKLTNEPENNVQNTWDVILGDEWEVFRVHPRYLADEE